MPSSPGERFHDVAGSPPLRLESVADVDALSGQSREMRHRGLVLYAHENEPVKPQALALLPKRIDLVLQDVKKSFRRVVKEMELSGAHPGTGHVRGQPEGILRGGAGGWSSRSRHYLEPPQTMFPRISPFVPGMTSSHAALPSAKE